MLEASTPFWVFQDTSKASTCPESPALEMSKWGTFAKFPLTVLVGCATPYPKTREKTRTRKFGSWSGRVSLNKISGFSGQTSENPKNLGLVGFRIIPGFWKLYRALSNFIIFMQDPFSLRFCSKVCGESSCFLALLSKDWQWPVTTQLSRVENKSPE